MCIPTQSTSVFVIAYDWSAKTKVEAGLAHLVEEQKDFLKHKWKALWSKTNTVFLWFAIWWFANFINFSCFVMFYDFSPCRCLFASYIHNMGSIVVQYNFLWNYWRCYTIYWVYCLLGCHLKQRPLEQQNQRCVTPRALDQVMTLQSASRLPWPSKGSQRRPRWLKKQLTGLDMDDRGNL